MTTQEIWQDCISKIVNNPSRVLVIGESTTGKTSFVTYLAQMGCKKGIKTAVLDMDVGQSNIGPPTTIGWGFAPQNMNSLFDIKPEQIYFIGNTSPLGKEREFATGIKKILPKAKEAKLLIVESVAFFKDRDFRDKMLALEIEIIKPDYIVVLKLGAPYKENLLSEGGKVFSLPGVIKKSKRNLLHRKKFRIESWWRYLKEGKVYHFPNSFQEKTIGGGLANSSEEAISCSSFLIGSVVGITDSKGYHLAAGVIFDTDKENISVFAPSVRATERDNLSFIKGEVKVEGRVLTLIKEKVNETGCLSV
ncbi:MAG: Clp1/GlmU family protein [candidate division WOR-3 bacterium]